MNKTIQKVLRTVIIWFARNVLRVRPQGLPKLNGLVLGEEAKKQLEQLMRSRNAGATPGFSPVKTKVLIQRWD